MQQSESPLIHLQSIIQPMHQCMQTAGFNHYSNSYIFRLPRIQQVGGQQQSLVKNHLLLSHVSQKQKFYNSQHFITITQYTMLVLPHLNLLGLI